MPPIEDACPDSLRWLSRLLDAPESSRWDRADDADWRSGPFLIRLRANLRRYGITRVADITGLDRIGIPVAQAVRPASLSNAVSQGKGLTIEAAAVSAILETLETYFAERIPERRSFVSTAQALPGATERFALQALPDAPADWPRHPISWLWGWDLPADRPIAVPLELVHTVYTVPSLPGDGIFSASTTGLGVAETVADAVVQGLLEVIERDAVARGHGAHGFFQRQRLDPTDIEDAGVRRLLNAFEAAGVLCGLWSAPAAEGFHVVWCRILEDGNRPVVMPEGADGFAADIDIHRAARRAMVEAAQSRLAAIAGAREDITRAVYPRHPDWQAIAADREMMRRSPPAGFLDGTRTPSSGASGPVLPSLLTRLSEAGVRHVIVVPVAVDVDGELVCVRVVAPELLPPFEPSP